MSTGVNVAGAFISVTSSLALPCCRHSVIGVTVLIQRGLLLSPSLRTVKRLSGILKHFTESPFYRHLNLSPQKIALSEMDEEKWQLNSDSKVNGISCFEICQGYNQQRDTTFYFPKLLNKTRDFTTF